MTEIEIAVDKFLQAALVNGGSITIQDYDTKLAPNVKDGANQLLLNYGEWDDVIGKYTLNTVGLEFAIRGGYAELRREKIEERKRNSQTRYIAFSSLAVAIIVAIIDLIKSI